MVDTDFAASPDDARVHFERRLSVETDVADVAVAISEGEPGFVLVDARSADAYAAGHLPGAISLARPVDQRMADELPDGLIVTYCWGPACNGATRAAARLAAHGRRVKEMLGGYEGWTRDGHPVERLGGPGS